MSGASVVPPERRYAIKSVLLIYTLQSSTVTTLTWLVSWGRAGDLLQKMETEIIILEL